MYNNNDNNNNDEKKQEGASDLNPYSMPITSVHTMILDKPNSSPMVLSKIKLIPAHVLVQEKKIQR